jgi:phospholipid/cholesterol/gamma-HCH transport system substrate-binding protein
MLQALDRLSTVATDVVDRSRDDMVADLRALAPILGQLAEAGKDLPQSLQMLPTFPFPDSVLPAVKGDYVNAYVAMIPAPGVALPPPGEGVPPGLPPLPLPGSETRASGGS